LLTKNKTGSTIFEDKLLEVEKYIEKHDSMNTWSRIEIGVKTLAQIHNLLRNFGINKSGKHPLVSNHVEIEYALSWAMRGVKFIQSRNPRDKEKMFCEKTLRLADRISKTQRHLYEKLPRCLAHGDYWDNNVFMQNNQVYYVADFDFMGERARIDDIAYTIFAMTWNNYSKKNVDNIKKVLASYDQNLKSPLSSDEKKALPLILARTPLAFIGIIASLENEEAISNEIKSRGPAIDTATQFLNDLDFWQKELLV
jgi:Ser/Thr protein kinase RdoA (MazF antagonist)